MWEPEIQRNFISIVLKYLISVAFSKVVISVFISRCVLRQVNCKKKWIKVWRRGRRPTDSRCLCILLFLLHFTILSVSQYTRDRQSQSPVTTDGQSVSLSWCRAPSGAHDQMFGTVWQLRVVEVGRPLWREDGSVISHSLSQSIVDL
jgi:hypothetical protein